MVNVEYTITNLNQLRYNFAFDYLKKKYVKVSSKNITTGVVTKYTYGVDYVVTDSVIELLHTVGAVGDVLRIVRETSPTEQIVAWNDASILKASDMSLAQLQQLHILEEYGEYIDMYSLTVAIDGQYDAKHSRIINLLDPQTATDAANKGYVDSRIDTFISSQGGTISSILSTLGNKVDKEAGKGLSSNDYTNTDKSKVHDHLNISILDKIGESLSGVLTYNGTEVSGGSGGSGTSDHNALINRSADNQHTINAIQGLQAELDKKVAVTIGKGLSSNDYDNTAKSKVDNLSITQAVDLDAVESASHTHTNTSILNKIGESSGGNFTYNGVEISGGSGGGGGSSSSNKYIYTVNNTFTATKAGVHNITAVAGGGGGTSCMGCGGGSGQSVRGYAVTLGVGDTISFTIGMGGSGSKVVGENVALPSSGGPYAGANGGNTVITISKSGLPAPSQTITLTGGGGGSCPTPSSIKYQAGIGENNGGTMVMSMLNGSTGQTAWTGGNGGSSIFGNGGSGGVITYDNFQKIPGKNAIAYGAGGGGGGFRQVGASGTYYWTAGGDGMQGCVVIEVE